MNKTGRKFDLGKKIHYIFFPPLSCQNLWVFFRRQDILETNNSNKSEVLASSTWGQEGGEIVEDLRVDLASGETHHGAHVQGEGAQLLPRAQAVHLQHVLHVVEEAHKQVAGVGAGGEHCGHRGAFHTSEQRSLEGDDESFFSWAAAAHR